MEKQKIYDAIKKHCKTRNDTNKAVEIILDLFNVSKSYFVIRRYNCSVGEYTDIIGITNDESKAKSMQSVFCNYEEAKFLDNVC